MACHSPPGVAHIDGSLDTTLVSPVALRRFSALPRGQSAVGAVLVGLAREWRQMVRKREASFLSHLAKAKSQVGTTDLEKEGVSKLGGCGGALSWRALQLGPSLLLCWSCDTAVVQMGRSHATHEVVNEFRH